MPHVVKHFMQIKYIPQSNDLALRKLWASPAGYSQKPDFVRFFRNKADKIIADRDRRVLKKKNHTPYRLRADYNPMKLFKTGIAVFILFFDRRVSS